MDWGAFAHPDASLLLGCEGSALLLLLCREQGATRLPPPLLHLLLLCF